MPQHIITSLLAEDDLEQRRRIHTPTAFNTSAGTIQVAITDASTVYLTGSTPGCIVKLPNATTLRNGAKYEVFNVSTVGITVQDFGGNTLATISPGVRSWFFLTSNASSNGTWVVHNPVEGKDQQFASSLGPFTNLSQVTYSTMLTINTPSLALGNYELWYSILWSALNNNRAIQIQTDEGGIPIDTESYFGAAMGVSAYRSVTRIARLTNISGVKTYNLTFRVDPLNGATTVTVVNPRFKFYRVS